MSLFSIAKTLRIDEALKRNVYVYHVLRNFIGRINLLLPLEPDFAAFGILPAGNGIFLDIGANDGISARSFRQFDKTTPILSVEANPRHRAALERTKNALAGFDYKLIGAGDRPDTLTLYTPVFRGLALTAYSSMDRAEAEKRVREHMPSAAQRLNFEETVVSIVPLDELALTPAFVKIDVEGFEVQVLRGMIRTIERTKPIFMIEHVPGGEQAIHAILAPLGYGVHFYDVATRRLRPYNGEHVENLFHLPSDTAV